MFSSPMSSPFGRPPQVAHAYRQVAVHTGVAAADPHRLVALLYDGLLEAITEARGAMQRRQLEPKGRAIGRAVRIVEEGLRGALNMEQGGRLASDLNDLYLYIEMRLTQANLRNDEAALDECQRLLTPLREAWMAISSPGGRPDA